MPKKVFDQLINQLIKDIRSNYPVESRYRTVRDIAARFKVSLQTAHRGVQHLSKNGMVKTAGKHGISIKSHEFKTNLAAQTILVFSANPDPRFNEGFLSGIKEITDPQKTKIKLTVNKQSKTESLEFGEYLLALYQASEATAIIALYFRQTELPFYHLISQGVDIIADISLENLPILPSVQTDNAKHTQRAAQIFSKNGKNDILVTSFWDRNNVRYNTFHKALKKMSPEANIQYLNLREENSQAHLYLFFENFNRRKGIFSLDYSANYVIAPYFLTSNINVKNTFLVYDCENEFFNYNRLKPIQKVAPSFCDLGRKLAEKLIFKMERGFWQKPLTEKI